jgi:hypothetical protein
MVLNPHFLFSKWKKLFFIKALIIIDNKETPAVNSKTDGLINKQLVR